MKHNVIILLAGVGTAALISTSAQAQGSGASTSQSNSTALEDIVVTARKREESLMSVPVAVSAISETKISQSVATDLNRIASLAPNVQVTRADSGAGASFTIRGLGTPFTDAGLEQSVTVNIDGVQVSRGNIVSIGLFDLQQVEILKGPQALFFGKNSPAGVISLRSVSPTDSFEGYVRGGYEFNARERYLEGAFGGPISDTIKARLALRGSKSRGWLKNVAGPVSGTDNFLWPGIGVPGTKAGHNWSEDLSGRLTVAWDPTPEFSATLKVAAGITKDSGSSVESYCPGRNGDEPTTTWGVPDPYLTCSFDDNEYVAASIDPAVAATIPYSKDGQPFSKTRSIFNSLSMSYSTDTLTFTSVTGYAWVKFGSALDYSYGSYVSAWVAIGDTAKQFSQELRVVSDYDGPLNFTVGGYYEDARRNDRYNDLLVLPFPGGEPVPDPRTGSYQGFASVSYTNGKTSSAFGQLRWDITDRLQLAGGVRYTKEKKDFRLTSTFTNIANGSTAALSALPEGAFIGGKFKDSNWSPEINLSYKPAPSSLIYAAYKTGYKSGGYSRPGLPQTFQNADNLRFGSEKSKGGEIGAKAMLFDRSVRLEATAYSYLYNNLQVSSFDQANLSFFIKNAATVRIKGIELTGEWRATPQLSLNGSANYNSAKFKNFPTAQCFTGQIVTPVGQPYVDGTCQGGVQDLSGESLTRAPEWVLQGGFTYDIPLGSSLTLGLSGDVNHSSAFETSEAHNPAAHQEGYTLFNAGVRLYTPDNNWELAFVGRNLTDKKYQLIGIEHFGATATYDLQGPASRGREWRIQATHRF